MARRRNPGLVRGDVAVGQPRDLPLDLLQRREPRKVPGGLWVEPLADEQGDPLVLIEKKSSSSRLLLLFF